MKRSILPFIVLLLALFGYTSCMISDKPTNPPGSSFFFIQASPNAPNVDVFTNGGAVALNFPYKSDTGYFLVYPQSYEFKVAPAGTANYFITSTVSFQPGLYYSLFMIDSLSKARIVSVGDNIVIPGGDSSSVRFLQFSPNTPYVTAQFHSSTDTLTFSGRSFNDQLTDTTRSTFKPVKAGTYSLALYLPGAGTPFAEFPGISLLSGKVFTVYLRGFYDGTGAQALEAAVMQNSR